MRHYGAVLSADIRVQTLRDEALALPRFAAQGPRMLRMLLLVLTLAACRTGDRSSEPNPTPDRFVAATDGVVRDQRTGLLWTSGDHDQSLPWDDAERYCRELVVGSEKGWRLPEIEELQALYDLRFNEACGSRSCHLDPAIRLAEPYVWSVSTRGPGTRFYFDFAAGNSLSPGIGPKLVRRVLCVRPGE